MDGWSSSVVFYLMPPQDGGKIKVFSHFQCLLEVPMMIIFEHLFDPLVI